MAIEKYTTKCIVVEAFDQSEHDRVYRVFTRDFGLITVAARSVRKLESKLRGHVMPRSLSLITVVHGREVWRLTGAEGDKDVPKYIHEVTALIKRFIKGEEAHITLYDRLAEFLVTSPQYEEKVSRLLLYYIFLVELGYADARAIGAKDMKEYAAFGMNDLFTHLILSYDKVRSHISRVLEEMQL